jgi:hypothetical protein
MKTPELPRRSLAAVVVGAILFVGAAIGGVVAQQGRTALGPQDAPWALHLRAADDALAGGNVRAAEQAMHAAYLEAIVSQRWEGMVDVGEAYHRLGDVGGSREGSRAKVLRSYAGAVVTARRQGSIEGLLRAAEAYAASGYREAALRIISLAEYMAARGHERNALSPLPVFRERVAPSSSGAGRPGVVADLP